MVIAAFWVAPSDYTTLIILLAFAIGRVGELQRTAHAMRWWNIPSTLLWAVYAILHHAWPTLGLQIAQIVALTLLVGRLLPAQVMKRISVA